MSQPWIVLSALVVASNARAAIEDGQLGSSCDSDGDCAYGFFCWTPGGVQGLPQGPAGGLCTAPCAADPDCSLLDATAVCAEGLCRERCEPGVATLEDGESKCHGRNDMACAPHTCADPACASFVSVCSPLCSTDEQCGSSLYCNLADGLCEPMPSQGDALGSSCTLAAENTCAGVCIPDIAVYYSSGELVGVCAEPCIIGSASACPGLEHAPRPRGCFESTYTGLAGPGDVGHCLGLCDCSSECADGELCERWALPESYAASGICTSGVRQPDSRDCLNQGGAAGAASSCAYGPVRACKTARCLGSAECLPNGEYSECQCLASGGQAGESGDSPPSTSHPSSGPALDCVCQTPGARPAHGSGLWLLLLLLLLPWRGLRRSRVRLALRRH